MGNRGRRTGGRLLGAALATALVLTGCSSDTSDTSGTSGTSESAGAATSAATGSSGSGGADTSSGAGGSGGELRVLSYNVAGLPQGISSSNPEANIPQIAPGLADYDLVLTQEDFDWWDELASSLDFVHYHERLRADADHRYQSPKHPGPEAVGLDLSTGRQRPEVGDGLGILARFAAEGDDRVPWHGCFGGMDTKDGGAADCLAMKGFQRTTLTLADGALVDVYNLHGEAGGTEEDQRLQGVDFEQLAIYINEHSDGRAIILGGDTNLHTGGDHPDGQSGADEKIWQTFLEATGLTDSCEAVNCPDPEDIDKIAFGSSDTVTLSAVSHTFVGDRFQDAEGEPLSDHEPLEVVLRWAR